MGAEDRFSSYLGRDPDGEPIYSDEPGNVDDAPIVTRTVIQGDKSKPLKEKPETPSKPKTKVEPKKKN